MKNIKMLTCILIIIISVCITAGFVQAEDNLGDLEVFMDGIMNSQLNSYNVPGASLAVVKDGQILLLKGYGYADQDKRIEVTADTLFRPGSVSKLFTWTAVMQLVEEGKIDLNKDINSYLTDFKIPRTYSKPVTMKHLLTHTPGFEEKLMGLLVEKEEEMLSLEEFLASNMPERIFSPGEINSYSNYGTTLAGYIVAKISGRSFSEYVEQNIFKPLAMESSTFSQPLPSNLKERMARGYRYIKGRNRESDFEIFQQIPAGALTSSASDMANFMLAHLQKGRFNNKKILKENTIKQMHSHQFSQDPRLSGWTYGFMETDINGKRIIKHEGDTLLFHSGVFLIPDENLGIYVTYNSQGGAKARTDLLQTFMDHYYPDTTSEKSIQTEIIAGFKNRANKITGSYIYSRSNFSTVEKILTLFNNNAGIKKVKPGVISLREREISRWIEIKPYVFREVDGDKLLIFKRDEEGHVKYGFNEKNPTAALIKVPWYGSPVVHFIILGLSVIIFLTMVIRGVIRFVKIKRNKVRKYQSISQRLTHWLTLIVSTLNLIFITLFLIIFNQVASFLGRIPITIKLILIIPLITIILTGLLIYIVIRSWKKGLFTSGTMIYYTIVTLFSAIFGWFLYYWNLIILL